MGGQVLGVVSAGDASMDATNRSEDVEVDTGDAFAANDVAAFVGLTAGSATVAIAAVDIFNVAATNVQEGDNDKSSQPERQRGCRETRWVVRWPVS